MGLFDRLFNRGKTAPPNPAVRLGLRAIVPDAVKIDPDAALGLSSCWAAVRLVSQAIACSEVGVFRLDEDGVRHAERDPGTDLLNWTPNPEQLASEVKEWIVRDMLVRGCGYAELVRTGGGKVAEVWPLHAERVRPRRTDTWELVYDYTDDRGGVNTLRPEQLLVVPYGRSGESVLLRAMRSLALANAEQGFALQHFAGGVNPGAVISIPGKLTPKQRAEFFASVIGQQSGPGKNSGALVLDGGATLEELTFANLQQAQLLEARKFSLAEVARCFGIAPALLGDDVTSQGYGSNHQAFLLSTYRTALLPVAVALSEALTRSLYRPRSPLICDVDLEWYLDGGRQAQATADEIDVRSGILTVNEVRAARGKKAVTWGDRRPVDPGAKPEGEGAQGEGAQGAAPGQDPSGEPAPGADTTVQQTALNGAQTASMLTIVQEVAAGRLPRPTAEAMLRAAFPAMDPALIATILDGLDGFTPPAPEPAGPPPGASAPGPDAPPAEGEGEKPAGPPPAARALAALALGRHATRCSARRSDLRRSGWGEEEVAENVAELAQRAEEELSAVLTLAGMPRAGVALAVSSVTAGATPAQAADRLLGVEP